MEKLFRKSIAIALLIALPTSAQAAPCVTVTTTITDLRPRTPREVVWFDTAVCYRKKWLDQKSETKSATTALAARIQDVQPENSSPLPLLIVGGAGIGLLGFLLGFFYAKK